MFDCLIVGAGPAGLTAAYYLQRFRRSVCIVDNQQSRARKIPLSHNYPGFPEGISGEELLSLLKQQLEHNGGKVTTGLVTRVKKNDDGNFSAEADGHNLDARTVLLAGGVVDIEPVLSGYDTIRNKGRIRFCPICDAYEFTDERIGVLGNSAHSVRECEFIKTYTRDLTYINLSPGAALSSADHDKLQALKVPMLDGQNCRMHDAGEHMELELADGSRRSFDILYCALGCNVRSVLAIGLGAKHDETGLLQVDAHQHTDVEGLYAAGDIVSGLHQIAVATGQGAIAATAIHNRLRAAS